MVPTYFFFAPTLQNRDWMQPPGPYHMLMMTSSFLGGFHQASIAVPIPNISFTSTLRPQGDRCITLMKPCLKVCDMLYYFPASNFRGVMLHGLTPHGAS
jgi:hypothetical protein